MKKIFSLVVLFLLVFSAVPIAFADETEDATGADAQVDAGVEVDAGVDVGVEVDIGGEDITPEELEELALEDVSAAEATVTDAVVDIEYTRTFYFLTEKILTAEAVIAYLNENYPDVDTSSIESYKAALEKIKESLTEESDFQTVHDEVVALIEETKEETAALLKENEITKEDIIDAVHDYKEENKEDDEAKEKWGEARSGYVHAKATVVLARIHNFQKIAEHYGQDAEELDEQITELETIAEQIANAAGDFNKEQIQSLVDQAKNVVVDAKDMAKDIRFDVKEAHKQQLDATKQAREEAKIITGVVVAAAKEELKEAREAMKEAREEAEEAREAVKDAHIAVKQAKLVHGSARGAAAVDVDGDSEEEAAAEAEVSEDEEETEDQEAEET